MTDVAVRIFKLGKERQKLGQILVLFCVTVTVTRPWIVRHVSEIYVLRPCVLGVNQNRAQTVEI